MIGFRFGVHCTKQTKVHRKNYCSFSFFFFKIFGLRFVCGGISQNGREKNTLLYISMFAKWQSERKTKHQFLFLHIIVEWMRARERPRKRESREPERVEESGTKKQFGTQEKQIERENNNKNSRKTRHTMAILSSSVVIILFKYFIYIFAVEKRFFWPNFTYTFVFSFTLLRLHRAYKKKVMRFIFVHSYYANLLRLNAERFNRFPFGYFHWLCAFLHSSRSRFCYFRFDLYRH